jgi:GT2 family glycosyltransferase
MNKAIEVIIVNYNAGDALLKSVSSALDPEGGIMVKVVDNASTDGSVEKLQGLYPEDGGLEIQCNQENLGFARAVNLAARGSTADYLLVLNPDCELHPGALDRLHSALRSLYAGPQQHIRRGGWFG